MYRKTKGYRNLEKRISQLNKHLVKVLLPKDVMHLTSREMDLCRGFKVLCHAEMEGYFEGIAKILVHESSYIWRNEKKILLPIVGLLGNYEKIDTNDTIDTKINKVMTDYLQFVNKKNHGIKSDNIDKLYTALGINCDRFDNTWLTMLDSFGNARGLIAHTSASVQSHINIGDTVGEINHILDEIENFEKEIENQSKINLYEAEKRYIVANRVV